MDWWTPSTPENIRPVPWMHPAAVAYLETLLTPDMYVIEHGCGGSTLWFAERVKWVRSFERNLEWLYAVRDKQTKNNILIMRSPLFFIYEDFTPNDLLLVDGHNQDRPEWIRSAPAIVKPGGVVVVDNSERPLYKDALQELATVCTKPTIITAWTDYGKLVQTSFYRLKGGANWI